MDSNIEHRITHRPVYSFESRHATHDECNTGLCECVFIQGQVTLGDESVGFIKAISVPIFQVNQGLAYAMETSNRSKSTQGLVMQLADYGMVKTSKEMELYGSHVLLVDEVGIQEDMQGSGLGTKLFEMLSRSFHSPIIALESEPMICADGFLKNIDLKQDNASTHVATQRIKLDAFYENLGFMVHPNCDRVRIGRVSLATCTQSAQVAVSY